MAGPPTVELRTDLNVGTRNSFAERLSTMQPDQPILDDEALIDACLIGDETAWERLLARYSKLIYTIPLRFRFEESVAEEIFQEVCLIVLEKIDTLRDRRHFKTWLVTIVRRACLQRLRNQDSQPEQLLTDQVVAHQKTPEHTLLLRERLDIVHRVLITLDDRCQQLLWMLFFEETPPSYEALAQLLDIPVGSIGPTRARCLEKFRQAFIELDA